ncbi:MAG TPA: acyltransferase, partial [Bacteroidia bacterium]|nr:acyltransferase [Bacteroidia bacterium]
MRLSLLKVKADYSRRVYGLDVFRAVAILLVVMGHGSFLINMVAPDFPYILLPDGVELFFVLSG